MFKVSLVAKCQRQKMASQKQNLIFSFLSLCGKGALIFGKRNSFGSVVFTNNDGSMVGLSVFSPIHTFSPPDQALIFEI